jgi:hypothetical protein
MIPQLKLICGLALGLEHETIAIVDDTDDVMEPEVYMAPCWHLSLGFLRFSLIFA